MNDPEAIHPSFFTSSGEKKLIGEDEQPKSSAVYGFVAEAWRKKNIASTLNVLSNPKIGNALYKFGGSPACAHVGSESLCFLVFPPVSVVQRES